jgi:hypothetical protein
MLGRRLPITLTERSDVETIYEKNGYKVEVNTSDEIFVHSQNGKVRIRISPNWDDITVTAGGNYLEPWSKNGLPAFRVSEVIK